VLERFPTFYPHPFVVLVVLVVGKTLLVGLGLDQLHCVLRAKAGRGLVHAEKLSFAEFLK
jgi:hypothetical protein